MLLRVASTHGYGFPLGKDILGRRWGQTLTTEGQPLSPPGHQILHGAVRGWVGSPEQQALHPQAVRNGWGRSVVILLNGSFTIILSKNWIISFSRRRVRLLLLKNVASSLYSLISFIQEKYLYLLLSLIMHLLLGLSSPKAFTLNRNAASGVSSV